MNSFILINGVAFWVLLIVFLIFFFVFIAIGNGYLKSQRQNDLKDRQLSELQADYDLLFNRYKSLQNKYKKTTFKVPTVDETGEAKCN